MVVRHHSSSCVSCTVLVRQDLIELRLCGFSHSIVQIERHTSNVVAMLCFKISKKLNGEVCRSNVYNKVVIMQNNVLTTTEYMSGVPSLVELIYLKYIPSVHNV